MEFLIGFALLALLLVVPVMLGARVVNAGNTGFGSALLAVVILAALSAGIEAFVADKLVAVIATLALGAMVLAGILGNTFLRGLAVSAIATLIQVGVIVLLAVAVSGDAAVAASVEQVDALSPGAILRAWPDATTWRPSPAMNASRSKQPLSSWHSRSTTTAWRFA